MMNIVQPGHSGWIEVICGPMFSGKTEELIRRLRRAMIARQNVLVFKPRIDTRFDETNIISHSKLSLPSIPINSAEEILEHVDENTQVVGIDEVQFFDNGIVEICQQLADKGVRVICAGLDQDYRGVPFEPVPQLLAIAEYITKTLAICMVCGNPASRTQRLVKSKERILVGASNLYEARCRKCHTVDE
ncbi:thymidine kinase [Candidatus Sumerlaeota bacterium]|nr:thymidine kinase [Candidatus Sumerlaeota bacterium]